MREVGIELIHAPDTYALTSNLPNWYPLLKDVTPRSIWFEDYPTIAQVEAFASWPIFVKGERQTNRHRTDQCVIESPDHFLQLRTAWVNEPVLAWQRVVCREFVPLRRVVKDSSKQLAGSFEFRCFCWRGECVGLGPYWTSECYSLTEDEREKVINLAQIVAGRIDAIFLVVDIAQAESGDWIVIEINDAQDSGYAGVAPLPLWRRIIDIELSHPREVTLPRDAP
ncbi:MAG: ATP-grasp domain-containing protein [Phycisphaeraceae bacterium]